MERFFRALFPGRVTVCGKTLPQLSLWRLSALQAVQSPFVCGNAETMVTPSDLTLAVQIVTCGNMQPPDMRPGFWAWRWTRKMQKNPVLWHQQARLFVFWLQSHQLSPELWRDELREPRYITAPLVMSQVAGLVKLGIPHAEAWDTSPGYASWLLLTAAERECDGIKFAGDEPPEMPPPLNDEAAIREQAKKDLGRNFPAWLDARLKNKHSAS